MGAMDALRTYEFPISGKFETIGFQIRFFCLVSQSYGPESVYSSEESHVGGILVCIHREFLTFSVTNCIPSRLFVCHACLFIREPSSCVYVDAAHDTRPLVSLSNLSKSDEACAGWEYGDDSRSSWGPHCGPRCGPRQSLWQSTSCILEPVGFPGMRAVLSVVGVV